MAARQGGGLRLVFLACCQSATRSPADAFRGLGPALVAAGVPAVVAMQEPVALETARSFAATFYGRLARHGFADLAANEARSALLAAGLPGAAVPVAFLRLKNGRLLGFRGTLLGRRSSGFWTTLIENIADGECTPSSARGSRGGSSSPADLARSLAAKYGYPFPDEDNLPRVAQFVGTLDPLRLRREVLRLLGDGFRRWHGLPADPAAPRELDAALRAAGWSGLVRATAETEVHHQLADLGLPLYLTTNFDSLMTLALEGAGRRPRREALPWREAARLDEPHRGSAAPHARGARGAPPLRHGRRPALHGALGRRPPGLPVAHLAAPRVHPAHGRERRPGAHDPAVPGLPPPRAGPQGAAEGPPLPPRLQPVAAPPRGRAGGRPGRREGGLRGGPALPRGLLRRLADRRLLGEHAAVRGRPPRPLAGARPWLRSIPTSARGPSRRRTGVASSAASGRCASSSRSPWPGGWCCSTPPRGRAPARAAGSARTPAPGRRAPAGGRRTRRTGPSVRACGHCASSSGAVARGLAAVLATALAARLATVPATGSRTSAVAIGDNGQRIRRVWGSRPLCPGPATKRRQE